MIRLAAKWLSSKFQRRLHHNRPDEVSRQNNTERAKINFLDGNHW